METEISMIEYDDGRHGLLLIDADDRTVALFEEHDLHGGGPTWQGIAEALLELHRPDLIPRIELASEADNFYATSTEREPIDRLASLLRSAIADHTLLIAAIEHAGEDLE